uniref:FAD/NAD(P)-binding domain-containing protein n=1 Tax=Caulobacter sp. (strain K31) TaxID=366602 RepID=B0T9H3_CAUSK
MIDAADWNLERELNLRAASIDGMPRLYFLGPFASRINFAAQQNRALNLISALEESNALEKDKPIAVIGAGLSGVTAATALHLLGYEVHLIEEKGEILPRQSTTHHRIVHPTVNAWPFSADLLPTTQLPFFDWCADVCDKVMAEIRREWKALAGDRLHADKRLHLGTHVATHKIHRDGVTLTAKPTISTRFGAVIFATGFEEEAALKNHKTGTSYWRDDALEQIRAIDTDARFLVSGTGDGGLIDALRLCHTEFMSGALALNAVTRLYKSPLADEIKAAEQAYRDSQVEGRDLLLWETYQSVAARLPKGLRELLDASLTPHRPLVYLVGVDLTPVARDAAPIHKLLVAHAERAGALDYIDGVVKANARGVLSIQPRVKGTYVPTPAPQYAVIRHGAEKRIQNMLKVGHEKALTKLISNQTALLDSLLSPFWRRQTFVLPNDYPRPDPTDQKFRDSRRPRAQKIQRIWEHLEVSDDAHGYKLETSLPEEPWYPKSLFGVPVQRVDRQFRDRGAR